jgi:hypothetical protein
MIDSKKLEPENGYDLRLEIDYDPFGNLSDFDGFTQKQIEAYNNDEWYFVSVEVIASKAGVDLGSASYGSIEYGLYTYTNDKDEVTGQNEITINDIEAYVAAELAGEAISRADEKLKELTAVN